MNFRTPHGQDPFEGMQLAVAIWAMGGGLMLAIVIYWAMT